MKSDYASGIRLLDCSKLALNWKKDNGVTIYWHDLITKFFWRCFIPFVRFSYWFKFHVNIIIGSEVMTIFFHKGLTRNQEIRNTLAWVFPNIWRLERVRDTKFGTNISYDMLLNDAKCHCYSLHVSELLWAKVMQITQLRKKTCVSDLVQRFSKCKRKI